jgi:phosphoribosylaminoimidazole-succinocarboxamide synthase
MGEKLGEGKTKEVFDMDEDHVLLKFKDSITAGDGLKKDEMEGKGILNAQTSAILFRLLEKEGIKTHYVGMKDERTMIVKKLSMIPVEVVARNIATGSIVKRLPIKEGEVFNPPIVEFFLKDDVRHDPLLNYSHMEYFKLMNRKEANESEEIIKRAINVISDYIKKRGLILFDLKLEFGRIDGEMIVGDEISLDSMRVRSPNGDIYDKDLYRRGESLEKVKSRYQEFLRLISN